jgi:hypothetical protein
MLVSDKFIYCRKLEKNAWYNGSGGLTKVAGHLQAGSSIYILQMFSCQKLVTSQQHISSRRCLHFDVVGGLEWSNDAKSYAGGSVATGRASLARQVKGDDSS